MTSVAVIGAGIVGVTTAYELAADGCDVTVFERCAGVAAETSFANAGVIAPGYVTPWAAPGMPSKVLRHLLHRHAPVRLAGMPNASTLRWMWRWWRACRPETYAANRARMLRLALYSRDRLHVIAAEHKLDYDRADGFLVLLRATSDLTLARPGLKLLAELGLPFHLVDAQRCRQIEPALSADAELHAGIHLPRDEVGNCRQFAHHLKAEAARRGAVFRFGCEVVGIAPGARPQVRFRAAADKGLASSQSCEFDAVAMCAALGASPLLAPLGLRLPLAPVYGYSVTAPLRTVEAHPDLGPRAAVMDERYKVAISRLGNRIRVAGGAELGGTLARHDAGALATLYKVLDDWFPGAARHGQAQSWKGARPMLPDGPPVIGASGRPGVWLNLGHGSSGWALACGSARALADLIGGRAPSVDLQGLGVERLV
jgi:D-amino-acid dehydrogenase